MNARAANKRDTWTFKSAGRPAPVLRTSRTTSRGGSGSRSMVRWSRDDGVGVPPPLPATGSKDNHLEVPSGESHRGASLVPLVEGAFLAA